jgi:hypothetical protein
MIDILLGETSKPRSKRDGVMLLARVLRPTAVSSASNQEGHQVFANNTILTILLWPSKSCAQKFVENSRLLSQGMFGSTVLMVLKLSKTYWEVLKIEVMSRTPL